MATQKTAQEIFDKNIGSNQELGYKEITAEDVMACIKEALQITSSPNQPASNKITKQMLLDFGMKDQSDTNNGIVFPFIKELSEKNEDGGGCIALALSVLRNTPELVLVLPDGALVYLGGCASLDELKIIEKSITAYEPNY